MPSGPSRAHGCDPRPPALHTSIASALPCDPAIGAWIMGSSMPSRERMSAGMDVDPGLIPRTQRHVETFVVVLRFEGVRSRQFVVRHLERCALDAAPVVAGVLDVVVMRLLEPLGDGRILDLHERRFVADEQILLT